MTTRIGSKGQVVIPKSIRDRVGLHPGDEVEFDLHHDEIIVRVTRSESTALGGRFGGSGMASRLLTDRRREPR